MWSRCFIWRNSNESLPCRVQKYAGDAVFYGQHSALIGDLFGASIFLAVATVDAWLFTKVSESPCFAETSNQVRGDLPTLRLLINACRRAHFAPLASADTTLDVTKSLSESSKARAALELAR